MDKLQDFPNQRVFQISHVALALDLNPSRGGLHRLGFGFAVKHVCPFFPIGGKRRKCPASATGRSSTHPRLLTLFPCSHPSSAALKSMKLHRIISAISTALPAMTFSVRCKASWMKRCHFCVASRKKNRFITTRRKNGASVRCGAT